MSVFKRVMGMLLAAVLLVGLVPPVTASAAETEETVRSLTMETEMQVIDLEEFAEDDLYTDYNPGLASGSHVRWIDRLSNLPAYAMDFYNWFGENSDNDGVDDALIDVSTAAFIDEDGWCLQPLTSVSGSVPFTAAADADEATLWAAADAALANAFTVEKEKVCGVIYAVTDACDRDYPQVFWRSYEEFVVEFYGAELVYEGSGWVAYYELDYYYTLQADQMDIRAPQYQDVSYLRSVIAQRDNAVTQIIAGMPADGTRAETVAYFNDWLTMHNCYNTSADLNNIPDDCRTCISALTGRVGTEGPVCEGYAEAMKVLCDRVGIPCVLVDGAEHMWNYIQMEDGNWYAVDTTWNDPTVDGVSGAVSGYESQDYLLVGGSTVIDGYAFLSDHPVENFASEGGVWFTNGPVLSDVAYDFGSSEPVIPQLAAPVNPIWGHEFNPNYNTPDPGMIAWNSAEPTQGVYEVMVYRVGDDEPVMACQCDFGTEQSWFVISDFKDCNPESGDYYFTVTSIGDGVNYLSSEPAASGTWSYTRPVEQLGTCTNLGWGQWPAVSVTLPENASLASAYTVLLYYAETADAEPQQISDHRQDIPENGALNCLPDFAVEDAADGYYYYKIRLLSGDTNSVLDGDWSELSPAYHLETPSEPEQPEEPVGTDVIQGSWTTDIVFAAADLGVSAPDAVLRATLAFRNGAASCTWEAVDLTAMRLYFRDMFVNAYYALAYGMGITDITEIEQFCMDSTGMSVSAYMDTIVTMEAINAAFTPASTSGSYVYNDSGNAIYTDMAFMGAESNFGVLNSFVIGGNTMYLNAASYGKPDYTFVCTRVG